MFQLDDAYPNLTLNTPTNGETLYSRTVTFNFTATDAVDSLLGCNITLDEVANQTGIATTSGAITLRNISGISVGSHNWSTTCVDNTGFAVTS
jgi:hypothetical protein